MRRGDDEAEEGEGGEQPDHERRETVDARSRDGEEDEAMSAA